MHRFLYLTLVAIFTLPVTVVSAADAPAFLTTPRILPVDQAFMLSAIRRAGSVELRWQVQPGYYLYRHSLDFRIAGHRPSDVAVPPGTRANDEFFGEVEVYRDQLVVTMPVEGAGDVLDLEVTYQGCADAGYCYPPRKKQVSAVIL